MTRSSTKFISACFARAPELPPRLRASAEAEANAAIRRDVLAPLSITGQAEVPGRIFGRRAFSRISNPANLFGRCGGEVNQGDSAPSPRANPNMDELGLYSTASAHGLEKLRLPWQMQTS